jgi:hypothetical protein
MERRDIALALSSWGRWQRKHSIRIAQSISGDDFYQMLVTADHVPSGTKSLRKLQGMVDQLCLRPQRHACHAPKANRLIDC